MLSHVLDVLYNVVKLLCDNVLKSYGEFDSKYVIFVHNVKKHQNSGWRAHLERTIHLSVVSSFTLYSHQAENVARTIARFAQAIF